ARGLLVAVRAGDRRLVAEDRRGLVQVERLALGQVLDDVHEHDVGVVAARDLLRSRRADVARPDDRDLLAAGCGLEVVVALLHQTFASSFSMIASATWLVPTAVGSSRLGFMS